MAAGKNPKQFKAKKGGKKKVVDPFTRKEWFHIKAPAPFRFRDQGWTPANRTEGQKLVADNLKGRIFEVNLADLQKDETLFYSKIKLRCEEVQGQDAMTSFFGLDFTTDKKRSLVRKWQTLIEAHLDVKTTDGYILRLFCIGFTRRMQNQLPNSTSYAQASQVKRIRRKMFNVMQRESGSSDLKSLVAKLISNSIGEKITRACQGIYPLQNVFIRKVKVLKSPKFDAYKFSELHTGGEAQPLVGASTVSVGEETGAAVNVPLVGEEAK